LTEREPKQFAAAVQGLLDDFEKRQRYGCQTRGHAFENWTWENSIIRSEHHLLQAAGLQSV